jgi:hypothetical protein
MTSKRTLQPKAKVWARDQIDRHAAICREKYRYGDRREAQARATLARRDGIKLKAYQCAVCSQWHLRNDSDETRVRRGQYLVTRDISLEEVEE